MTQRKVDLDNTMCAGCRTPLSFLRGDPVRVKGAYYHPNCKPSQDPQGDREYWAGIREGYQYHQDKRAFGEDYADAADLARDLRREGYAADLPTPPAGKSTPSPTAEYPKIEGYDLNTVEGCRLAYRAARRYVVKLSYSGAASFPTLPAFDARVKADMAKAGVTEPTPRDWVRYAHRVTWGCDRCAGTGRFITGTVNGQPTGPGGQCFRCNGKGYQDARDAHRNFWHTMTMRVVH